MLVPRSDVALIVVDMQNGFLDGKGSMAALGFDTAPLAAAVHGCGELVEAARAADVPVIYTRYVYQPDYADGGLLPDHLMPAMKDVGALAAGSWDAEIIDALAPQPGDLVIDKSRYSAFHGTRLEPALTARGIRSLVVCGVTTNMCVETTVRDAGQRDYPTFTVSDATGEFDRERHEHALTTISFGFGWVVDTATVSTAWATE
ncbi:MAG: cysteine hydrolase [Nocardiopsaceae bacterium]|nr:cysteine hydrolase [Nocardiopsaceae bacterium]